MSKPTAIVYVDGFNLYKGQLANRPGNKWVNLVAMCDEVLDNFTVLDVHYFTAQIKGRLNPEDPQAPDRQSAYLRALRTVARMRVHDDSQFSIHPGRAREYVEGRKPTDARWISVYKIQEKGSDVKLATQLLMDAVDKKADCYVVVSNDSDLAIALKTVKERELGAVGVIYPREQRTKLFTQAGIDWDMYLHPSVVERNQLPDVIQPAGAKTIRRPERWKKQGPAEAGP